MAWEVEYTDQFGEWWEGLCEGEQDAIDVVVRLLEERGYEGRAWSMARKFRDLRKKMSPERRARNEAKALALLAAMDLSELRNACRVTQEELAARLEVAQSNVSRLERRHDMLVSTLRDVVEALGGELHLLALFPGDGAVRIRYFEETSA